MKTSSEIERLIALLARLPGLGPRSARRAALALLRRPDHVMRPLAKALAEAADAVRPCVQCGNLDTTELCAICMDRNRTPSRICVVEDVGDLWAIERSGVHRGLYHVLGGVLSALDGIGPEDLRIGSLVDRARAPEVEEIILALSATVEGQSTAHYVAEALESTGVAVTRLAHGLPVGGELDYLDDGTLEAAMRARTSL